MPSLTRRRQRDSHQQCWHVYCGDVRVGTITERSGVPKDLEQWEWSIGFYPPTNCASLDGGIADTFEAARDAFGAAWRIISPRLTDRDYAEHRRHDIWTAWKYAIHDAGAKLPTQTTDDRSRCFCGATINSKTMAAHIEAAHQDIR